MLTIEQTSFLADEAEHYREYRNEWWPAKNVVRLLGLFNAPNGEDDMIEQTFDPINDETVTFTGFSGIIRRVEVDVELPGEGAYTFRPHVDVLPLGVSPGDTFSFVLTLNMPGVS